MSFPLFVGQDAQADLAEAYRFYESQQLGLGDEFVGELDLLLGLIGDKPLAYPLVFGKKRRAVLRRFKFNVFFIFDGSQVQILAVMHGSRNPGRWQNR